MTDFFCRTHVVKKGVAANTPIKPAIVRNSYLEEYCLAYVYVDKGITSISQSAITDTRPNNLICGFVTGLIKQLDTSELFIQYQTAFEEWFNAVKDNLGSATLIRQYTSSYTTTGESESTIPINIIQFNKELDILNVFVNGMKLIQGIDYTKINNTQVTLTKPLCAGALVEFEVFKSIDGSNAETTVQLVYQLQTIVNKWEYDPPLLYQSESGVFPDADVEIVPSKPLSDCQHGWVLTFTGYDLDTSSALDLYVQTAYIPKRSYKNTAWNGESMIFQLVYSYDATNGTISQCQKTFYIHNSKIVSSSFNSSGKSRNMVLRSVQEY